jgi:hypothetical protein
MESNLKREKNPIFSIASFLHIGSPSWNPWNPHFYNYIDIITVNYEKDYNSNILSHDL